MIRVGFRWLERGLCRHPEIATLSGGSLCAVDFPAMVGVIEHPARGILLFDTGYDPAFIDATETFPERFYRWTTPVKIDAQQAWSAWLATHGIEDSAIVGTIISHFHGDHVAGMCHLAQRPVYCARAGLSGLRRPGRFGRVRQGLLPALVPQTADANARFFEDAPAVSLPSGFAPFSEGRDILGDGSLVAVELPGHCVGHWGLALRTTEDRQVLLAADAVWLGKSITQRRPPPRLTTALLGDTRRYRATLNMLSEAACCNGDLVILPSHCAASAKRFGGHDAN
ncbi:MULTISPECIES: MBL fold metallo-hydrolase [Halomonadaceae]|uniref:4-pyridoxolactonase n=1 Tax=Vreelandella titanicae TaxID=664683 RepID=A0AAP9SY97_9GAMM|nr:MULTISPECIES: MBL fold metallo-hydrolase [Halomonas]QKS22369.1 4-pyridoxolactonase [Halomonas titanicae]CDG52023.1 Metal-dependent hydrolase, beta-lactamase superfamily III [Halomonas sp. A3H3]SDI01844.1 Metallo-beta-lactamase superfamily protein [Halomonas titanicae]